MCRLFGFRAGRPSNVHRSLLREKNALMRQSVEHPDGWGIAFYHSADEPTVVRGAAAAFADGDFARIADVVSSDCVMAHIRKASVGPVRVENSHPFRHGRWVFAHNGTITDFARHRAEIEGLLSPAQRAGLSGDTDSERCAALFASELAARGDPDDAACPMELAAEALRATVRTLRAISDTPEKPSSLTFLATNGRLMLACRLGRELHVSSHKSRCSERDACADFKPWCEGPPGPDGRVNHFLLASEKISAEDVWTLIPEGGIVGVDGSMRRYDSLL